MKTIVTIAALASFLTVDSSADLTYSAPGMDNPASFSTAASSTDANPASVTLQVTNADGTTQPYWEFRVTGINVVLNAGNPLDGRVVSGGHLENSEGRKTTFSNSVTVKINGKSYSSGALNAANVDDDLPVYIEVDETFSNEVITISFEQDTEMTNDSSYVIVQGTAVKFSPKSVGSLTTAHVVINSKLHCNVAFDISRATGELSPPDITVVDGDVVYTADNKGHGNNADGVDAENTGAAYEKWVAKGSLTTEVIADNDADIAADTDTDDTGGGN